MRFFRTPLYRVYTIGFVFALSMAFTAYVNSTFLGELMPSKWVGILFSISAILTLIGLEILPICLSRYGIRKTATYILITSIAALTIIANTTLPAVVGICFVLYITANNLIVYCLDIFIEHFANNRQAGRSRGAYLSVINLAWMLSPFAAGVLVARAGFGGLYLLVLGFVAVTALLQLRAFPHFKDSHYDRPSPLRALTYIKDHAGIKRIIILNFVLQFFFAWMVIFTPIYLREVIGFGFTEIGIIFTVMLAPFVILQFPLGALADRGYGEKRLLIIGLIVMMLATGALGLYHGNSMIVFAAILFATRVGAATVEVMTETYFFKTMEDREASIISLFRTTGPVAYIIAPLLGTALIAAASYSLLFIILAIILIGALYIALPLRDLR